MLGHEQVFCIRTSRLGATDCGASLLSAGHWCLKSNRRTFVHASHTNFQLKATFSSPLQHKQIAQWIENEHELLKRELSLSEPSEELLWDRIGTIESETLATFGMLLVWPCRLPSSAHQSLAALYPFRCSYDGPNRVTPTRAVI